MRSVLGLLGVTATAGSLGVAWAQAAPAGPSFALVTYSAPPACPSAAEFERRVRTRLGGANPGGAGRTLGVDIQSSDGQYVGRVSLVGAGGRTTAKTLRARECDDLVDALALVSALALQSEQPKTDAGTSPAGTPSAATSASPSPAPASASGAASAAGPPSAPPVAPPPPVAPEAGASTGRAGGDGEGEEKGEGARFAVELGGLVAAGPAPDAIFGGTIGAGWTRGTGLLSPAVALGLGAGASPSVTEVGGQASFAWLVLRLEGCGLRIALGGFVVRACLLGDAGVVNARGSDTDSPASSSRGWLSVGASTRWELPIGERFGVHLVAGVEAPLRRDRYAFGTSDFFEVPAVIATGSASVAAYFR